VIFDHLVQLSAKGKHGLTIEGGAVGTIVFTQGEDDATEVRYRVTTIRSDQKDALERVWTRRTRLLRHPDPLAAFHCMEFELAAPLPPGLKDLSISTDSITHIGSDEGIRVGLNSHR